MLKDKPIFNWLFIAVLISLGSCSQSLEWPDSPLYELDNDTGVISVPEDKQAAMELIVGHYAHYDAVAYFDSTTQTPMHTFIISYGFTDFYIEDGKLMQVDKFLRANQKINQKNITSEFRDESVQAIKPRVQEVELTYKNGKWHLFRPATPTLLGITGDPSKPLSTDPDDPNLTDPDGDGNPGVTVEINIGNIIKGEIYITRREIYRDYLTLNSDGTITGYVRDDSEQFVVGASRKILAQPSNSFQHPDMGLSPIILVRIDEDIDTLEELWEIRDDIFPPEPEFR